MFIQKLIDGPLTINSSGNNSICCTEEFTPLNAADARLFEDSLKRSKTAGFIKVVSAIGNTAITPVEIPAQSEVTGSDIPIDLPVFTPVAPQVLVPPIEPVEAKPAARVTRAKKA